MRGKIQVQKVLPPRRRRKRAVAAEAAAGCEKKPRAYVDRPTPRKCADERFFDPRKHQNWLA